MAKQARFAMEFCAVESCGKCTPCRIGSTRGAETIDKIVAGIERVVRGVEIFADVHVKHAVPLGDWTLEDSARDTIERGLADALIGSGVGTG